SFHALPKKIDIIASYDYFNRNKSLSDKQTNYTAGVQYWFYPQCRLQMQHTFRKIAKEENSNLFQVQLQVRF
ncbi:MAG: porin, partial [Mediterranea sp.]|nr:porin [Mediterranea sp.]